MYFRSLRFRAEQIARAHVYVETEARKYIRSCRSTTLGYGAMHIIWERHFLSFYLQLWRHRADVTERREAPRLRREWGAIRAALKRLLEKEGSTRRMSKVLDLFIRQDVDCLTAVQELARPCDFEALGLTLVEGRRLQRDLFESATATY